MCIANVEHISLTQLNFYKDLSKKEGNKYVQTSQKMELLTLTTEIWKFQELWSTASWLWITTELQRYVIRVLFYIKTSYISNEAHISNELHWMLLANERNPPKAPNMYFFFKSFLKLLILIKHILNKEKTTNHLDVTI